ncbi:Na(+)/H(+) antiporter subunit F1 [Lysinibacillus sp. HST-98]|uniref:Monovalent cation/H+ antiporter subunit F n=4 Tax=Bacillaceae TaxID=186817 RepID=A0A2X0Z9U6_9BACI|nr:MULTISPECIES: Na(+)/H(+) antiporter subunit F1 [Lysinibacillus]EFI66435.1 putative monovalent cation/H+ antiporter subunit F [Lysinibacillus fusiformis ZC1]EKU42735.1 putative monovalent cation/H+ antiporter subunit F [Lysinibacillus fusiformis ZB2]AUS84990.1 Na(+)/H(+) antiporter subunit F [Lysinibacillus sp. YS11]KGR88997.1 monovalent cation/H+ antiporter subunit F [Lysinibacillus boronitolerans JCM 21713 = 10a = NBRC 103108]KMN36431.1 monovalent cation/H+ antiporter subunit F [Lysinibaci
MINNILLLALAFFSISIALSLYRVIRGPSMPDRAIALDTIGVNLLSAIAIVSIILKTKAYLEAILILGILAFIGTIAFTKYIERGVIVERKSND